MDNIDGLRITRSLMLNGYSIDFPFPFELEFVSDLLLEDRGITVENYYDERMKALASWRKDNS